MRPTRPLVTLLIAMGALLLVPAARADGDGDGEDAARTRAAREAAGAQVQQAEAALMRIRQQYERAARVVEEARARAVQLRADAARTHDVAVQRRRLAEARRRLAQGGPGEREADEAAAASAPGGVAIARLAAALRRTQEENEALKRRVERLEHAMAQRRAPEGARRGQRRQALEARLARIEAKLDHLIRREAAGTQRPRPAPGAAAGALRLPLPPRPPAPPAPPPSSPRATPPRGDPRIHATMEEIETLLRRARERIRALEEHARQGAR